ncbi:MAG: hypothetical protein RBT65_01440 [Methanolobus sp.]|nr:hypothetical protein [Methanolobus sp.]
MLPDDWTAGVPNTQRYKYLGNSVSPPFVQVIVERKILSQSCINSVIDRIVYSYAKTIYYIKYLKDVMESKIRYYFGSMVFLSGLVLSIGAIGFAIMVHLNRTSDPSEIITTYGFLGTGLSFTLLGINLMISQRRPYGLYSNLVMIFGFLSSICGVVFFATIYSNNWVYPNVSYVAFVYASGICLLSGNVFGNAVVKLIEERSRLLLETDTINQYSIEDIEKEVEKTLNESLSNDSGFSAFSLDMKEDISSFVLGKALKESPQNKIEVKDSIREVECLQNTISGKIKVTDSGIDLTSKMLSATMKQSVLEQNKSLSDKLKTKFNSIRR